jgi:hypothetical protein
MNDTRQVTCPSCGTSGNGENEILLRGDEPYLRMADCQDPWHTLPPQAPAPNLTWCCEGRANGDHLGEHTQDCTYAYPVPAGANVIDPYVNYLVGNGSKEGRPGVPAEPRSAEQYDLELAKRVELDLREQVAERDAALLSAQKEIAEVAKFAEHSSKCDIWRQPHIYQECTCGFWKYCPHCQSKPEARAALAQEKPK